ncbi:MAG: hypothetical protein IJF32_13665, partial [Oscillospiraceae bacterium]|nr:hypothetical protein [Oscillospiraceae bacterium]
TEAADTVESFGNRELQLEGNTSYYLLFRVVGNDERLTSTGGMQTVFKSFKLTYVPSVADEAFDYAEEAYTASDTATVTALAAYGNGDAVEDSEVISLGAVEYGKACTVSVKDETVEKEGKTYSFLYWARGAVTGNPNKKVLSTEASFSYMPSEGNNILIAVYEEPGAEKSEAFYNYNGQLLADLNTENGKLPTLPSMAGFEAPAKKWVQLGTNAEFDAGADVSGISGGKVFMAKYDAPISNIEITVNGVADTYSYGDTVTCTPSAPEGKVFMYWTKTVGGAQEAEIVSMEENYSFSAWESCTVTAVYGDKVPSLAKAMRKIVIGTFAAGSENAIMAEFIGFDDALEKGIMLGEQKLAMTTDKTQFTVINDDTGAASVVGYAIVSDGNGGYSIITDGAEK